MPRKKNATPDTEAPSEEDVKIAQKSGPDAEPNGRFTKVFTVAARDVSDEESDNTSMHEANKVAVLQDALNRGLHPQSEATFDGAESDGRGSTHLTYSVPVVLASADTVAADTYTPSSALKDQGGTTVEK